HPSIPSSPRTDVSASNYQLSAISLLLLLLVRLALARPAARSGRKRRREPCPPAIGPRMASRAKRAQAPAPPLLPPRGRPSHGQPPEAGAGAGARRLHLPSALAWPAARSGRKRRREPSSSNEVGPRMASRAKRAPAPARPLLLQRGRPSDGQPREAGAALTVGGYATEMQLSDSERASGRLALSTMHAAVEH